MANILFINSSARSTGSISRQVAGEFVAKLQAAQPGSVVVERDVAANPIPHLDEQKLGAFFTPADKRTAEQQALVKLSEELIAEVNAADIIVIGAPMYNFSITSTLKTWIDHVARAGVTFKYTETGPVGLVQDKKVYVFTSRGGVYSEGPAKAMDFHETYLRAVLGFIGMTDITFIHSEGLGMGEAAVEKAVAQTRQTIGTLIAA
ncbi:FMN-dependent NADH-azoreductase [Herbaspirillum sp. RV1423]|uniref:FMN-dependent NADH-azoreductase n=1 Tax=Herbaspirillum sp. RV1423 TaxID=1443993 RepID=UPI0004B14A9C|nr:FMN-dependent NADH-azoreductase [Herbaspirillum sp. RV1423]